MTALGLILARGGSKRIPHKNTRLLGGKPLITWTLMAASQAHRLDATVVSSDSDEIINIAAMTGAACIKRPAHLATDDASSYGAILHAIEKVEGTVDYVCLLQPTSPFRQGFDIDNCWEAMKVLSPDARPAAVSIEIGKDVPNGAVYWAHVGWLVEQLSSGVEYPWDGVVPARYIMDKERSIDIDTEHDWDVAAGMLAPMGVA